MLSDLLDDFVDPLVAEPAPRHPATYRPAGHLEDGFAGVHLQQQLLGDRFVCELDRVLEPKDRIEADRVEVIHLDGVTAVLEPLGHLLEDRVSERAGVVMRVDDQDSHRSPPGSANRRVTREPLYFLV